jgi:thiamine-phosphate pyrophosphorylase
MGVRRRAGLPVPAASEPNGWAADRRTSACPKPVPGLDAGDGRRFADKDMGQKSSLPPFRRNGDASDAMASGQQHQKTATRAPARLYLVTPALADAQAAAALLDPALAAADIAAVLLRLAPADERTLINRIKEIAPMVQDRGAALLVDGHAGLAARAGADGAHLTGIAAMQEAIAALKPERIVGAGGLASRHDAMMAAEAGADYVMFGEPDAAGGRPSFEAIRERVEWWAEVFEIPCVAYAASLGEIAELAAAEFVALGPAILSDPRGPAAPVADAAACLAAETLA